MSRSFALTLAIVAILAAAVAVWVGQMLVTNCVDAFQLRDAVVVDAIILNVERKMVTSGDGTKEQVFVTYAYEYDGRRFEHRTQRLKLFGYTGDLPEKLEAAMNSSSTVQCYVSPTNPSLSVFSLEFSWLLFFASLLFPLFFGSVAVLLARTLLRAWRQRSTAST